MEVLGESDLSDSNSSGCDKLSFSECLAVLGMGMGFMGSSGMAGGVLGVSLRPQDLLY